MFIYLLLCRYLYYFDYNINSLFYSLNTDKFKSAMKIFGVGNPINEILEPSVPPLIGALFTSIPRFCIAFVAISTLLVSFFMISAILWYSSCIESFTLSISYFELISSQIFFTIYFLFSKRVLSWSLIIYVRLAFSTFP